MQRIRVGVIYLLLIAAPLFLALTANASSQSNAFRGARWRSSRVEIALSTFSQNNPNIRGDIMATLRKSAMIWAAAADLDISLIDSDRKSVSSKGLRGDGVSLLTAVSTAENLQLFPKQENSPAATTRIFVDRSGVITEADIVLNPFVQFSNDGTFGTYDLQDTLIHEIGHLLGLDHSLVRGAIMYEFGSRSTGTGMLRTRGGLASSDVAAVRSLYGPKQDDLDCCGTVSGRVSGVQTYRNHRTLVWLEDGNTGRVMASTAAGEDGSFRLDGVSEGKYRLNVSSEVGQTLVGSDHSDVLVETAGVTRKNLSVTFGETQLFLHLLGLSPLPTQLPVRIGIDDPTQVYIGGYGIQSGPARVSFSSNSIIATAQDIGPIEFEDSIKMFGFSVSIPVSVPRGEYTLIAEDTNGVRRFIVGGIIVGGN